MQKSRTKAGKWILDIEGGYVNDPDDAGRETKYGISKRSFPNINIKALTKENALEIYFQYYWQDLDLVPYPLDIAVFDWAVNSGSGSAIRGLQATLNQHFKKSLIMVDGAIGIKTLQAIDLAINPIIALDDEKKYKRKINVDTHILETYLLNRQSFYLTLIKVRSLNKKYFIGWINRIDKLKKLLIEG